MMEGLKTAIARIIRSISDFEKLRWNRQRQGPQRRDSQQ